MGVVLGTPEMPKTIFGGKSGSTPPGPPGGSGLQLPRNATSQTRGDMPTTGAAAAGASAALSNGGKGSGTITTFGDTGKLFISDDLKTIAVIKASPEATLAMEKAKTQVARGEMQPLVKSSKLHDYAKTAGVTVGRVLGKSGP